MGIKREDVKLLESERLTDEADGGGRMTGTEVEDGAVNNLFPDISRLDRTYGRVNLRKAYAAVMTEGRETYHGAHVVVGDQPEDDNVSILLFDTGSHTDERSEARNRIEAYLIADRERRMHLVGTHLEGQQALNMSAPVNEDPPDIGETLAIEDHATEEVEYVRVTAVDDEVETFIEDGREFQRRTITADIGQPLARDYEGGTISRTFSDHGAEQTIRGTIVADAARYYGTTELEEDAPQGTAQLQCRTVYGHLVPATEAETVLTDQRASREQFVDVETGGETVEVAADSTFRALPVTPETRGVNWTTTLRPRPEPGTVVIEWRGLGRWERITDDGEGGLEGEGTGTIDYDTGAATITLTALPDAPSEIIIMWGAPVHYLDRSGSHEPDRPPLLEGDTDGKPIVPGSLQMEWLSGDETKTASDDGQGQITGDATGRVNYASGLYGFRPDDWPDPDTQVHVEYDEDDDREEVIDPPEPDDETITITVEDAPIRPGSLQLRWTVRRSEAWSRSQSSVRRSTDETMIYIDGAPSGSYGYEAGVRKAFSQDSEDVGEIIKETVDDGEGGLKGVEGGVDYATGEITFRPTEKYQLESYRSEDRVQRGAGTWAYQTETLEGESEYREDEEEETFVGAPVTVRYGYDDTTNFDHREDDIDVPPLQIDLRPRSQEQIMPGSLRFTWGDHTYEDQQGALIRDDDLNVGTVEYGSGMVEIETVEAPGQDEIEIETMVTARGEWGEMLASFRTPGSPIRPGTLTITATTTDGREVEAQADEEGNIDGDYVQGSVDADSGRVDLVFGYDVPMSEIDTEDPPEWYREDFQDADGENVWRPLTVAPGSIRFNAVALRFLPLEADILGLDPVRLPQDGRVPLFRPADVAVISHTDTEELPEGVSAGETYELSRDKLALVLLRDADGNNLPDDKYSIDRKAGTVTIESGVDLDGHPEPLQAVHRIEDMVLVSEVQVTGRVTLARGVSREYPEGSQVASAMVIGDMRARVYNWFTEESWDGEWSDEQQGDGTLASYNRVDYPPEVTNEGAIPERWALRFTDEDEFEVIGEGVGLITIGNRNQDTAPENPMTGKPYFTIRADGWGGGWSAGNTVRFNTDSANHPLWMIRTILAGESEIEDDEFTVQIRGDAQ